MEKNFDKALAIFIGIWENQVHKNFKRHYDNIKPEHLEFTKGRKYVKITEAGHRVCAFIDMKTGDIFKPAGWAKPAKHARGNIFSENNGMEAVSSPNDTIFAIRYLK